MAALVGDRVLSASMLAMEAGVSISAIGPHLRELVDAGTVTVTRHGRYRYYRLAAPHVTRATGSGGEHGPLISSLRRGTRANLLRRARRCRGHLAGRLGCALTSAFIDNGFLTGHDGSIDLGRLSGAGGVAGAVDPVDYTLTDSGVAVLAEIGVAPPPTLTVHCCVDWTEHRHHIAGAAGRGLLERCEQHGWIRPGDFPRAVTVTPTGRAAFADRFGVAPSILM